MQNAQSKRWALKSKNWTQIFMQVADLPSLWVPLVLLGLIVVAAIAFSSISK